MDNNANSNKEKLFIYGNIEYTEGQTEIKDEIKNHLYKMTKSFDRIVVLSGAGTSIIEDGDDKMKAEYKYGYLMSDLIGYIKQELSNDETCYDLDSACKICKYNKENNEINLEDFLSQYESSENFVKEEEKIKYENTRNKIYEIIRDRTKYDFYKDVHIHDKFIKQLSDMHTPPNRLTIVTTNYDTLFEEAADELGYTIIDGFNFLMEPRFDADIFNWSLIKPIVGYKTDKFEYKKNVINLIKIHGSLTWIKKKNNNNEESNICRIDKNDVVKSSNGEKDIQPLLIFPGKSKFAKSYEEPYFELFSVFQNIIHSPKTLLIIIGFGFNDRHIVSMIEQAIRVNQDLSVLIIDPYISELINKNNLSNIKALMNAGYNIAFLKSKFDKDLIENIFNGGENEN